MRLCDYSEREALAMTIDISDDKEICRCVAYISKKLCIITVFKEFLS